MRRRRLPIREKTVAEKAAALGWTLTHDDGYYRATRPGCAMVRAATGDALIDKLAYLNDYRARFNKPTPAPIDEPEADEDGIVA